MKTTCPKCGHEHTVDVHSLRVNPATERMYRLSEIATMLGLSKRSVWRHIRRKSLRGRRMHGATTPWLVSESDLLDFRQRHNL